jgi:hypothetical protein
MSFLHSRVISFRLSTALWVVVSLWSLTSCGVSGTTCSSKFVMRCYSYWISSSSCTTCCGTRSSAFTSMTVTERSALFTISFTSSFSTSNFSFSFYNCSFSSSNFAWKARFSHSTTLRCSTSTPCTCVKAWVACAISSCAHRR